MPAHSTQGSLAIVEEHVFHAIQSVGSIQSKAASQIALIGTAGSSSDDESSRLSSQFSSDSLSRHDDLVTYSREQRARQLREARAARMKLRASEEVLQLDCSIDDLCSTLRAGFDQLVSREKAQAVTVYNIVINSLTAFYERNGGQGSIENRICDFLSSRFIITSLKARTILEDESIGMDRAMVEVTSMLLLQLYVVLHEREKGKTEKGELMKKLRHIYIHNCASAQRAVVEEDITDVFGAVLPLFVSDLFVELELEDAVPVDLEEILEAAIRDKSLSVSSTASPATNSPPLIASPKEEPEKASQRDGPRASLSSRLEAARDEFLDDAEPSSERSSTGSLTGRRRAGDAAPTANGAAKSSVSSGVAAMLEMFDDDEPSSERSPPVASQLTGKGQSQSLQSQTVKRKAPPATPNRDDRRPRGRRVYVPETPDEKGGKMGEEREGRRTRSQMKEDIKVVVRQTPMEKMRVARKSTRGDKLAELSRSAAASPSLTGGMASALRSRVRNDGERRASRGSAGTPLFAKESKPMSRDLFLSANRDKGEKKSRVRVSLTSRLGGETPGRAEDREKEERRRMKKRKTEGNISTLVLDSDAISKYKKRMKETVVEGNNGDDTEVFYGRMSNRVGLFDDRHEKEEAKVVYNRAGRVVYSPSCVFVAHTLLNVHNKTPLLPSKPSTSSAEFKLNRLVRPASKGNRLKLKKLKERLSLASPKKEVKKEEKETL